MPSTFVDYSRWRHLFTLLFGCSLGLLTEMGSYIKSSLRSVRRSETEGFSAGPLCSSAGLAFFADRDGFGRLWKALSNK